MVSEFEELGRKMTVLCRKVTWIKLSPCPICGKTLYARLSMNINQNLKPFFYVGSAICCSRLRIEHFDIYSGKKISSIDRELSIPEIRQMIKLRVVANDS